LATEFAVFNGWFSSIPGPTICNRAFAHYGTSFGQVSMDIFYIKEPFKSIYERMINAQHTSKLYYYDTASSTMEVVNLLQHEPQLFGTYPQFLKDCENGTLPEYSFVEPNYSDHDTDSGEELANDQHPDHHVQAGELFIASVYNAIRQNPVLWKSTAFLPRLVLPTVMSLQRTTPAPDENSVSTVWACACPRFLFRHGFRKVLWSVAVFSSMLRFLLR
jgi:phospholipase C